MPRAPRLVLAAVLLLAAAGTARAAMELPPAPVRWVTDGGGLLTPAGRQRLDARLEAYERLTGHQVVVWIGPSLGGQPLDEWANRAFAAWKLGRKGVDDGVALFLFAEDRKIAIEVGYGLEDKVTDALSGRIIRDTMAPRLRAGDGDGAVSAAVDEILTAIEGRPAAELGLPEAPAVPAAPPAAQPELSLPELIFFGILGIIVIVILIRNPHLAAIIFSGMGRGGRGGGFGGGGGGFSGGGGRSGGGGARGGW